MFIVNGIIAPSGLSARARDEVVIFRARDEGQSAVKMLNANWLNNFKPPGKHTRRAGTLIITLKNTCISYPGYIRVYKEDNKKKSIISFTYNFATRDRLNY